MADGLRFSDIRYMERWAEFVEATLLITVPSWSGAAPTPTSILTRTAIQTVGTSQAVIAHGLSFTPKIYAIVNKTTGMIWESQAPDATNVYLTADAAARQCYVWLGR